VIRELSPGLIEQLIVDGAQRVTTNSGRWWQASGYRISISQPEEATFCSRPFLERGVRGRIEELPNVRLMKGSARQLVMTDGRVQGVAVDTGNGVPEPMAADLVIDATGRGSEASGWLEALGYEAPPAADVHIDMAYSSRLYRRTAGRVADGTWYVTIPEPQETKRIAVAFPIEADRWIVTLAGCHGDRAPTEDAGYLTFAESLPTYGIADIIRNEEPAGPIVTYRLPSSQWRHFDRLKRHPAGFLAIGDSICSFNPIYGQGMSSAAQQAIALGECIDRVGIGSAELWRSFYKKAKKVIANPAANRSGC
jgi:2-polyprenyl-6-methoxyphenol hydroxylase-like FAD-dependent oxidoreductase